MVLGFDVHGLVVGFRRLVMTIHLGQDVAPYCGHEERIAAAFLGAHDGVERFAKPIARLAPAVLEGTFS